ncbi:MAG TPA: 2Fe-2S iron-sulfur cluster-binding protein [Elainellaceae cyanobacterium]
MQGSPLGHPVRRGHPLNLSDRPVIRTYSLSDYVEPVEHYRLSIKRELPPKGLDVPPGVSSNFMHDHVQEGDTLLAKPPAGKFVLDVQKTIPAILLSNGVGITPMISMAKACAHRNPDRPLWFVHGARDGKFHAFRDEVVAIAQQNPNMKVHYRYSRLNPDDEGHYDSTGYVDMDLLQTVVMPDLEHRYGSTEAEYFICGSPPFMGSLLGGLRDWGVPGDRVFFESFNQAKQTSKQATTSQADNNGAVQQADITFTQSDQVLTWTPDDGTILEFAEANGLDLPYSCRSGICLTCMCPIQEGEVAYDEPPTGTPDEGSVLICISRPKTERVVLEA